jgi:hypothetical protein
MGEAIMSVVGHSRRFGCRLLTSGLHRPTDIARPARHVLNVPGGDSCAAANLTLSTGELEGVLPLVRPRQHDLELSEKSGLRLDIHAAAVLLYDDVMAH